MPRRSPDASRLLRGTRTVSETDARFRVALAAAPLAVFGQDTDLRYTWVMNPALGLTEASTVGRTDDEVFGADAAAPLTALKRRVLETGVGLRGEVQVAVAGRLGIFDLVVEPVRGASGAITGVVCAAMDITERRQLEDRMRQLTREILTAREEERRQVAAALHHDVGSLTVGIAALLDAVEGDVRSGQRRRALSGLLRIRRQFTESVARLKAVASQLRPPELDVIGLRGALRQQFQLLEGRRNPPLRIRIREVLRGRRLPAETSGILFRVGQEALNNVLRHSGARRVDVHIAASPEGVSLTVRDDGKGFTPSATGSGAGWTMGLRITREMVVAAGGRFEIESGKGTGTRMRAFLPFPPPEPACEAPSTVPPTASARRGAMPRRPGRKARREVGA